MDAGVDPVSNTGAHTIQTQSNLLPETQRFRPLQHGRRPSGCAKYAVIAGINKPVDPAVSGQTMANARILPATNRSGSFQDGAVDRGQVHLALSRLVPFWTRLSRTTRFCTPGSGVGQSGYNWGVLLVLGLRPTLLLALRRPALAVPSEESPSG